MTAHALKLNKKATMRIIEASQAQGLSPDALVLKLIPAVPKKPTSIGKVQTKAKQAAKPKESSSSSSAYLKQVEAGVKALRKDPKGLARAEERFFSRKPGRVVEDEEANRLADEAVRKYRASKKAKRR